MLSKSSAVTVCQQCKPPARRAHGEGQTELRYAHCSHGPGAPLREPMEWNTHHRSREVTKFVETIRSPFCGREDACGRRVGSTDTGSVAVYAVCAHHNPIHSQISEECAVSLVLLHRLSNKGLLYLVQPGCDNGGHETESVAGVIKRGTATSRLPQGRSDGKVGTQGEHGRRTV
jgi:hypothetical protein